ncbi:MAG: hypothetical protein V3U75_12980 [Methylococcaceae bacterium]
MDELVLRRWNKDQSQWDIVAKIQIMGSDKNTNLIEVEKNERSETKEYELLIFDKKSSVLSIEISGNIENLYCEKDSY